MTNKKILLLLVRKKKFRMKLIINNAYLLY